MVATRSKSAVDKLHTEREIIDQSGLRKVRAASVSAPGGTSTDSLPSSCMASTAGDTGDHDRTTNRRLVDPTNESPPSNDNVVDHVPRIVPNKNVSMTTDQKAGCQDLLEMLMADQDSWLFNFPVDADELGLPNYHRIIKNPMDLGTVQNKLNAKNNFSLAEFCANIYLTFDNAMLFNEDGSIVHSSAKRLRALFVARLNELFPSVDEEGGISELSRDSRCTTPSSLELDDCRHADSYSTSRCLGLPS